MKTTLLIFSLLFNIAIAQDGAKEKIYTQEEFDKKLIELVEVKLKRLGREEIIEFSKELLKKDNAIEIKNLEIKKREETLSKTTADFQKRLKEFQGQQLKFIGCIEDIDKKREKRISHMVESISGMKPVNAAGILSVQDAGISVEILGRLTPEKVSKIFNLMDKEISARLQLQYMNMKK